MTDNEHEFISREDIASGVAVADEILPDRLHIIPVNGRPLFPGQVQPIILEADLWKKTLQRVAKTEHHLIGISFVDDKQPSEVPDVNRIPLIGCVARVHKTTSIGGS